MSASQGGRRSGRARDARAPGVSRRRPRRNRPPPPFPAPSATRPACSRAPRSPPRTRSPASPPRRSAAATAAYALAGLRPGTYEITVAMPQYKPQSRTVQVLVGQTVTANFKISPDVLVAESVQVTGDLAGRNADVGDLDQRHRGAGPLPAAEPAQLPQLRRARARARASPTTRSARRSAPAALSANADQRLHRRRQLQERRPRRRRRRPGLEPRHPVPAERGAGVPGPDPELQGGAREGRRAW